MIRFKNDVTINRSLDQVFPFVADLQNLPAWNYYVENVTKISAGSIGLGTEFHQVRKEDEQKLRISKFIPGELLMIETIPPSKPELQRELFFEELSGKTHIVDSWELRSGLPGIVEKLSTRRVQSAVLDNLANLKELLETGTVTLQDGQVHRLKQ